MSNPTPTLKRYNHRVHPCKDKKKEELLRFLLEKNSDKKIIVVSSAKTQLSTEQKDVTILSDEELTANKELRCEMIISYDLPPKASRYIERITRTDTYALILVNPSEERVIHPIETLLGRTIMQENVEGFSEIREEKVAQPTKKDSDPREDRKKEFLSRGEDKPKREFKDKKPYSNDKKGERKPWEKKEKKENKFLGKDENGKAIFSGKSGERNHRYDGTPKIKAPKLTGKKINIKTTKKETEK
jgi:hypothetical protein